MPDPISEQAMNVLRGLVVGAPTLGQLNHAHLSNVTGLPDEVVKTVITREYDRRNHRQHQRDTTYAHPTTPNQQRFLCRVKYHGLTASAGNNFLARNHHVSPEYVAAVRQYIRDNGPVSDLIESYYEQAV